MHDAAGEVAASREELEQKISEIDLMLTDLQLLVRDLKTLTHPRQ